MGIVRVILAAAALLLAQAVRADLAAVVNDIRESGCGRRSGVGTLVATDAALDAAARLAARGTEIGRALEQAGYRATSSTLINIGGAAGDAAIREVLADGFCGAVNNRAYAAMGAYTRGNELWLVLAAPFAAPDRRDAQGTAARVLELVNEARAQPRRCGRRRVDAARPVTLAPALNRAAAAHAADMAANGYMGHTGSDGSNAGQRANRAGYRWRSIGENVAAGQPDADTVVQAWLDSPGHCANLMGAQYTEMGVAFELVPQGELRIAWAQVFATPQ